MLHVSVALTIFRDQIYDFKNHEFKIYLHFILSFKIMYLMPQDGHYDRNM